MSEVILSRRRLLTAAAGGAATFALPVGLGDDHLAGALAQAAPASTPPGLTPEIVTVTDTSLVAWWPTDTPSDTTIRFEAIDGPSAGRVREECLEHGVTMHVARVDGLRPGTRYRYTLLSGGVRQSVLLNGEADPGEVTTLVPPAGRRLARVAVMNDLHVGERCSGTITTRPDGTSFPPCNSAADYPDYAYRMDAAAIAELRELCVDLLIVNGDLTDRGREDEIRRCLELVRSLGVPLLITRGNHDRRLAGACAPDGDCLRAQAFPQQAVGDGPLKSVRRVGRRLAVVGLDSADPDTGRGRLDLAAQPAWLDEQLTTLEAEGRDIIVAFHHPIIPVTQPPSISDKVDLAKGGSEVLEVLARHPYVRLVLGGHTHRNNLGYDTARGGTLPFLENGAIKEYPAGYALLDVHEDGIMRTFHRPVDDWSRVWTKVSAGQFFGNHASITRGSLASRAFVVRYQSRLRQAPARNRAVVTTAQCAPRPAPRVRLTLPRRMRLATLLGRGLPLELRVRETVEVELRLRAGRTTIAVKTLRVPAGARRVRLRPSAETARALRRLRKELQATLTVRIARPGGAPRKAFERPVMVVPNAR